MKIPDQLQIDDSAAPAATLLRYYGRPYLHNAYNGALFDSWDSSGTRDRDADLFTADDLIAIGFLSVDAGSAAAKALLHERRAEFSELLRNVGPDRDLASVDETIDADWPAWELETRLRTVHGIGRTIATKPIARKRPKLYPIWDKVIAEVMDAEQTHLAPLHARLREDAALRERLVQARTTADLPTYISEIRVLDVIAWMQGKGNAA